MLNIQSWDDWFKICGEKANEVKEYEDEVFLFLDKVYKKDKSAKDQILFNPLPANFYKKEEKKLLTKFITGRSLLSALLVFLILFLFLTIKFGFRYVKKAGLTLFTSGGFSAFMDGFKFKILPGLVLGLIGLLITLIIFYILRQLTLKSSINKLKKKESRLEEFLKSVPPKYRNYECLTFISALYFEYPYITFSQALENCDDFIRKNRTRNIKSILYDLPYELSNLSSTQTVLREQYKEESEFEEETFKNPNLPQDITTKTFSGSEDAQRELNSMIGLDSVKQQVDRLKNRISFYGDNIGNSGNHMVFLGSAGTGKTTVARVITRILYDFGYISKNKCVEIDGDYLKSPYVGQTGERTSAIVDYAMGGVLFIDEAYLLYDKNNSTSAEATGVLLKAMEDHRKDFVVIFAGYEEQMTKLLASNEGFASRIKHKIFFPDYTVEEMYQIFTSFLNNYHNNTVYLIDDDAKELLLKNFAQEKKSKAFGNARTIRNAVDGIMDYHADRMIAEQRKSDTNQITLTDVKPYVEIREKELKQDIRNMSANSQLDESIIRLADLKTRIKEGSNNVQEELKGIIGIEEIKEELKILQKEKEFDGTSNKQFLFIGTDDTVKDQVASILTGFLYEAEYIRENRYLSISAEFLKGSYVGHTSRRTEAIISYANGGVLYIKNIGLLSQLSSDTFSQEAISMLSSMLRESDDLTVILSDTQDNINRFISSYPEFKEYITNTFVFPSYTPNQQLQIFNKLAKQNEFTIQEECLKLLLTHFEQADKASAQYVYNIFKEVRKTHISDYDEENKYVLIKKDFKNILSSEQPKKFKLKL